MKGASLSLLDQIPQVTAAVTCQFVITDTPSMMRTLVNVFSRLNLAQIPGASNVSLYVKMIDGSGSYQLRVRLVRLRDDKVVFELPVQTITWENVAPLEMGVNFGGVPFEEEGVHEFQIFMDDIYVGRSSFEVMKFQAPIPPSRTS
jgi:hypothetical protein